MNRLSNVLKVRIHNSSKSEMGSIDAMRVAGPARDRLQRHFGPEQMKALETQARWGTATSLIGVGIATDKGLRPRNEDSAIVMMGTAFAGHVPSSITFAAIADGMGGHAHGDRASAIAIDTMTEYIVNNFLMPDNPLTTAVFGAGNIDEMLSEGMMQAHSAVRQDAPEGGSTLTCVLLYGNTLHVAHVGDSRAYLVKAGGIDILTHDHLVVRQMEEVGILSQEEAARHPQRHVLYRVLGMEEDFEADVVHRELSSTSRLLLCSDGVWEALRANDIYLSVVMGQTPQDICERLIRDAIVHRANDNATAVLLHVPKKV